MDKEFKSVIAEIKYLYKKNQGEIAKDLGVTQQYLSDVINGRAPYNDTLRQKVRETFPAAGEPGMKEVLKEIKYRYNITQEEIAKRIGLTRSYLSEVVGGRAPFSDSLRKKIKAEFPDIGCFRQYSRNVEDAITEFMRARMYTVYDVAKDLGVPVVRVTETIAEGFDEQTAKQWAERFGMDENFLLTGEGELMPRNDNTVPLIPVQAHAGRLQDFSDAVARYDCDRIISPVRDAELAISITGESMYPEFPSGSIVFLKKINEKAFIEWGKPYCLDTCNGIIVKYIAPGDSDGFVKCISANPDKMYAPFEIPISEIYGFYRVVNMLCMK